MSKALELLANIDKKYNSELQRTEEQLLSGIEQTSQIIKDNLSTRANITATAIQQSDEKLAQNLQNSSQQIEKQPDQYQALLQSKLSRLKQMNEQIQTEEQQVQNKKPTETAYYFEYGTDFGRCYFDYSHYCAQFYGEKQVQRDSDAQYDDQRETNASGSLEPIGGSLTFSTCRQQNSKAQRLCIQINKNAGEWQNGYMIPMGY